MSNQTETEWKRAKTSFPVGAVVEGRVETVYDFGAFVSLPGTDFLGVIVITSLSDSQRALSQDDFPQVGSDVRAVVVGHRDLNHQIALSLRESDFRRLG